MATNYFENLLVCAGNQTHIVKYEVSATTRERVNHDILAELFLYPFEQEAFLLTSSYHMPDGILMKLWSGNSADSFSTLVNQRSNDGDGEEPLDDEDDEDLLDDEDEFLEDEDDEDESLLDTDDDELAEDEDEDDEAVIAEEEEEESDDSAELQEFADSDEAEEDALDFDYEEEDIDDLEDEEDQAS